MHEIQMLGLLEHDVLSSIEVPYMEIKGDQSTGPVDTMGFIGVSRTEADKFDLDVFALTSSYNSNSVVIPTSGTTPTPRPSLEKRPSHRYSTARIDTIEESPRQRIHRDLPSEGLPNSEISAPSVIVPSTSPSPSIKSSKSEQSTSSKAPPTRAASASIASKLAPSWLFNRFRSGPSEPQTTQVSASASASSSPTSSTSEKPSKSSSVSSTIPSSPIRMSTAKPTVASSQQIQPVAIKSKTISRSSLSRTYEEETLVPHRASFLRRSPINTPPRDEILSNKRRSGSALAHSFPSSSPVPVINPTRPQSSVAYPEASLARRWQHIYPHPSYKYDLHWKSIVTPGCLPLTVEHIPSSTELESSYDVFSYEFIIDPGEMRSFLVKPPIVKGTAEDLRRAWALVVMRGMSAVRLAQGFQFILRPEKIPGEEDRPNFRKTKSFMGDEDIESWPSGAAEVLAASTHPVYLSMSNEIHRISYTGEAIQVKRYVRRLNATRPFKYQCLIWPKLGGEKHSLFSLCIN